MNRWCNNGSSDGLKEANRDKVFTAKSSTLDELMVHWFKRQINCVSRAATAKWHGWGTWWTDGPEILASIHLTLHFSVVVSQRLFGCPGLFIPPPLTNLRLLDCVEVQRSASHPHIQSIQVLNCSSIDLHMLCVCLVLGLAYIRAEWVQDCANLVRWFLSESSCTRCAGSLGA
jgi:hypothetical protein